jgi:hypothetical protein
VYPVKKTVDLHLSAGNDKIFWYNLAYRGLYSTTSVTSLRNYGKYSDLPLVRLTSAFLDLDLFPFTPSGAQGLQEASPADPVLSQGFKISSSTASVV